MKKIFLMLVTCILMVSCIKEGYYTGKVVVVGKKSYINGNAFHSSTEYVLYGRTDNETIKWFPGELDYVNTKVGDTVFLYDVYYRVIKEGENK